MPAASTATPSETSEAHQSTRPQLLFFYSHKSGSSRRVEGFLAQVLQRRRNHRSFRLVRIEAEQRPDLVEDFRVDAIPALIVVADNSVRARLSTPRGCKDISETLAPWLN